MPVHRERVHDRVLRGTGLLQLWDLCRQYSVWQQLWALFGRPVSRLRMSQAQFGSVRRRRVAAAESAMLCDPRLFYESGTASTGDMQNCVSTPPSESLNTHVWQEATLTSPTSECLFIDGVDSNGNQMGHSCSCVCSDGNKWDTEWYGPPGSDCTPSGDSDQETLDILCALFPYLGELLGLC